MRKDLRPEHARHVAERLGMTLVHSATSIFVGDCPLCGGRRSLTVWTEKAKAHCYCCGLDGIFGAAPERSALINRGG